MELGERLKQARLEAGISQRQLCGDVITRNMLSQIENGSAKPSMDTLRYLAQQLGKPMGYFLEEQTVSADQTTILQAREVFEADPAKTLELLKQYRGCDGVFDPEYHLLWALSAMNLARQVLDQGRNAYAMTLLEEAAAHGALTPYYTQDHERRRLLLCYCARPELAQQLVQQLPDPMDEILLRASAQTDPVMQGRILDAAPRQTDQWHLQRAQVYMTQGNYAKAIPHLEAAPKSKAVYAQLELCCKELEDYKSAYYYALKAREGQ